MRQLIVDLRVELPSLSLREIAEICTEVSNPRVIEINYRSPQLTLWTLGPDEWLLFKKLPDYAPRIRRKTVKVIQLPLPTIDENQEQKGKSSAI